MRWFSCRGKCTASSSRSWCLTLAFEFRLVWLILNMYLLSTEKAAWKWSGSALSWPVESAKVSNNNSLLSSINSHGHQNVLLFIVDCACTWQSHEHSHMHHEVVHIAHDPLLFFHAVSTKIWISTLESKCIHKSNSKTWTNKNILVISAVVQRTAAHYLRLTLDSCHQILHCKHQWLSLSLLQPLQVKCLLDYLVGHVQCSVYVSITREHIHKDNWIETDIAIQYHVCFYAVRFCS